MLKIFNNGKLGFWILGALFALLTIFLQFDRTSFNQRLEAMETYKIEHETSVDNKEQQLWNQLSKMDVKINRILRELGYSDKQIEELGTTATTYERK